MSAWNLAGGAMAAIANYASNYQTNQTNLQIAREANAAERQIMAEQNAWNLDMWNRQNAYNDPSAQMSRLRAAGVNPALAYANGGLMNEAAPAQEAAGANVHTAQMQPYYLDPLTMAQISNLNADSEEKKSRIPVNEKQATLIEENANKVREEARGLGLSNSVMEQTMPSQVSAAIAKNNFDKAEREAAMQYVNDTAKAAFDTMQVQLDNLRKEGRIKDKVYEQKVEELRSLRAKAEIDEYERDNKEVGFWIGRIDSLWDLIALGVLKYKDVLNYIPDGSSVQKGIREAFSVD